MRNNNYLGIGDLAKVLYGHDCETRINLYVDDFKRKRINFSNLNEPFLYNGCDFNIETKTDKYGTIVSPIQISLPHHIKQFIWREINNDSFNKDLETIAKKYDLRQNHKDEPYVTLPPTISKDTLDKKMRDLVQARHEIPMRILIEISKIEFGF